MKELIKIRETENGKAVSARELHRFVVQEAKGGQTGEQFNHWIARMLEYGFVNRVDYTVIEYDYTGAEISQSDNQRVAKRDYALTVECAKEISMLQRNDRGKQARKYFIEAEKKLTQNPFLHISKAEALKLAYEAEAKNELLEKELKIQAPKAEYYDKVLDSKGVYVTNQIAKELGMSAVTLNRRLHLLGIQYKQNGTWVLYHQYQDKGLTKTRTYTYQDGNGLTKTSMQTVWTEKGREFIHNATKRRAL